MSSHVLLNLKPPLPGVFIVKWGYCIAGTSLTFLSNLVNYYLSKLVRYLAFRAILRGLFLPYSAAHQTPESHAEYSTPRFRAGAGKQRRRNSIHHSAPDGGFRE